MFYENLVNFIFSSPFLVASLDKANNGVLLTRIDDPKRTLVRSCEQAWYNDLK